LKTSEKKTHKKKFGNKCQALINEVQ
jgi:hypothetical protein